ncbi:hypothetical protein EVAR_79484_1 [Eumeta japonica]|uniref:Mos1 transposase HTH domain-containing protein n=1 Tax=Eumeta variegata TaxID=151549 RepID=A0A4C1UDQ9_EUMVA|nr:hypothetical protein EVAR_79484_1 [Eumeta japonica]
MTFYDFKSPLSLQYCAVRLQNAFGRKSLRLSTAKRWYAEFDRDRVCIHDEIREGRSSTAIAEENVATVSILEKVREKRPRNHRILLHRDDALAHTANKAMSFLTSIKISADSSNKRCGDARARGAPAPPARGADDAEAFVCKSKANIGVDRYKPR